MRTCYMLKHKLIRSLKVERHNSGMTIVGGRIGIAIMQMKVTNTEFSLDQNHLKLKLEDQRQRKQSSFNKTDNLYFCHCC